jgi:hypothetical protein
MAGGVGLAGAAVPPLGVGGPPISRLVAEGLAAWVEGVAPRIGRPSVPA